MSKWIFFWVFLAATVGAGSFANAEVESSCSFSSPWHGYFFQTQTEARELITAYQGKVYFRGLGANNNSCFSYRSATQENAPIAVKVLSNNRVAILETPTNSYRQLNIVDLQTRRLLVSFDLQRSAFDYLLRIFELGDGRILLTGLDYIADKLAVLNLACGCAELEVRREGLRASIVLPLADRAIFFNNGELMAAFIYRTNELQILSNEQRPSIYYGGQVLKLKNNRFLFWGGCQNLSGGECSRKLVVFDATQGEITKIIPIFPYIGFGAAVAELPNGQVLITGGQPQRAAPSTMTNATRVVDLERGLVVDGPPMRQRRKDHILLDIGEGRLQVLGGYYYHSNGTTFGPRPAPRELDEVFL